MYEMCIPHSIPRVWKQQEKEADTRVRVIDLSEIWKKGRWVRKGKSPKQGLTMELPEGRELPYHRFD